MRNLKKALSLALALVMLLGMMMVGAGAAKFEDVANGASSQEAVEVMNALEIIKGDGTGNFRPDDTLTRAEAAVIISKVLLTPAVVEKLSGTQSSFTDVANYDGGWAVPYVEACALPGIIAGNGDGTFDPAGKVTGLQFAKMLLVTLGFDPDTYNGKANWEMLVRQDAIKAKLDANGVVITSGKLSRAAAAQMAFNAITEYSPSGEEAWTVDGKAFDSFIEAYLYADKLGKVNDIEKKAAKDSLAVTRFKLDSTDTEDAFGRSTTTWTVDGKEAVVVAGSAPVLTVTEKIEEQDLFAQLGVTGFKGQYDNYVIMDQIWVDGVMVGKGKDAGSADDKNWWVPDHSIANWEEGADDYIAISNAKPAAGNTNWIGYSGNGTTIEIYATGTANHYKMIVVNEKNGTVSMVTPAKGNADRTVTVAGKTFATEDFAKGDVVLYTMSKGKIVDMKPAEKVENVTVTSFKGATATTSAGEYTKADGDWAAGNLGKAYDLYLNSCGYVFKTETAGKAPTAPVTDFAYIMAFDGKVEEGNSFNGSQDTLSAKVRAVLADGTVGVYDLVISKNKAGDKYVSGDVDIVLVANIANAAGAVAKTSALQTALDSLDANVYGYNLKDGKLTLSAAKNISSVTQDDIDKGTVYANAITDSYQANENGKAITVGTGKNALINENTVFVVIATSDPNNANVSAVNPKITRYTGSIRTTGALTGSDTWVVMTPASTTAGVANVVFTTSANVTTPAYVPTGYAYVDADSAVASLDSNKKTVYTYDAIDANGEAIKLTSGTTKTSGVYMFNDKNEIGAAQAAEKVTVVDTSINYTGKWLTLTDATEYVYLNGLDKADGNMCVVVYDTITEKATVVFVIAAPVATGEGDDAGKITENTTLPTGVKTEVEEVKSGTTTAPAGSELKVVTTIASGATVKAEGSKVDADTLTGTIEAGSGSTVEVDTISATGKIEVPANAANVKISLPGTTDNTASGAKIVVNEGANVTITGDTTNVTVEVKGGNVTFGPAPEGRAVYSFDDKVVATGNAKITINGNLGADADITVEPTCTVNVTGTISAAVKVAKPASWTQDKITPLYAAGCGVGVRVFNNSWTGNFSGNQLCQPGWAPLIIRWDNRAYADSTAAYSEGKVVITVSVGGTAVYQELGYGGLSVINTDPTNTAEYYYKNNETASTLAADTEVTVTVHVLKTAVAANSTAESAKTFTEDDTLLCTFTCKTPAAD